MGRIFDLLKSAAGERSLWSRLGFWRQEISRSVDSILSGESGDVQTTRTLNAGAGLTGGGNLSADRTFDVGQNADASILVNPDNIQLNPALGLSTSGGLSYMTQAAWFLDGVAGSDTNNGATAATALLTPGELQRRWQGRVVPQNTTITVVDGTFAQPFELSNVVVLPGFQVTLQGEAPTVVYSGSLTGAFVAYAPATNVAAQVVDAGRVFAADAQRRIIMTSGVANAALTTILVDLGANTARVGQFVNRTTGASQTPALGDTYNIETLQSQFGGLHVDIRGGGRFIARDCEFRITANVPGHVYASGVLSNAALDNCILDGCRFSATGAFTLTLNQSAVNILACSNGNPIRLFGASRAVLFGHASFNAFTSQDGSQAVVQRVSVAQGPGAGPSWNVFDDAAFVLLESLGVYDSATTCFDTDVYGMLEAIVAGARFFGSGNTPAQNMRIRPGCLCTYIDVPVVIGTGNDSLIGGVATPWGAVPWVNPANNAAIVVRA